MRPQGRASLIKLIHVAKRDLGMDDDDYRGMLQELTGTDSCSHLKVVQLITVLDAMKAAGFVVKSKGAQTTRKLADDDQSRKIRALWLELKNMGVLRDPSEAALSTYVRRMTTVDRLEWLSTDQASRVIETLKKWIARVEEERLETAEA